MKKLLYVFLILLVVGVGVAYNQLGSIVKVGVETGGPETLQVPVTVESVDIAPLSGEVSVKGFEVGQPEGFGEGSIASVASFDMKLKPQSLFSDHIIIESIVVDAPMLDARRTEEVSNFEKLQQNMGVAQEGETGASDITLTIKKMVIKGATVAIKNEGMLDVEQTVSLADFTISDLGTDEKGMAPAEIARHMMAVLQPQITEALIKAGASEKLKDLAKDTEGTLQKGLSDLVGKLKKKNDKN